MSTSLLTKEPALDHGRHQWTHERGQGAPGGQCAPGEGDRQEHSCYATYGACMGSRNRPPGNCGSPRVKMFASTCTYTSRAVLGCFNSENCAPGLGSQNPHWVCLHFDSDLKVYIGYMGCYCSFGSDIKIYIGYFGYYYSPIRISKSPLDVIMSMLPFLIVTIVWHSVIWVVCTLLKFAVVLSMRNCGMRNCDMRNCGSAVTGLTPCFYTTIHLHVDLSGVCALKSTT